MANTLFAKRRFVRIYPLITHQTSDVQAMFFDHITIFILYHILFTSVLSLAKWPICHTSNRGNAKTKGVIWK